MAIKKSELYSNLWASCDKLRGGMDSSQYKNYILTLLFSKYVTDKFKGKKYQPIEVPEGAGFDDMLKWRNHPSIGEEMNKAIKKLSEANPILANVELADFDDSNKLGSAEERKDKLTGLLNILNKPEFNFKNNRAENDDIIGDAYEYLMKNFATESGKSKGQFYTPGEVSRIMAKVIGISNAKSSRETLYDCACGSGSLLIRAAEEAPVDVTIYGQEKDGTTAGLAIMNLVLHNKAEGTIKKENTLAKPLFTEKNDTELKQFDYIVANPPFSLKNWTDGVDLKKYNRFNGYATPPEKNGDYAWLLHVVKSLKENGKGAIILPHGVLFRGNAEGEIRDELIKRGYIKGIIGLPSNLFFGTGIPACIIVLDKSQKPMHDVFIIDASKGFVKDGNKNRLREQDIHKIVSTFNAKLDIPGYSKMVNYKDIVKNEFNLNIPRYIENIDTEDEQDIDGHLHGGIPAKDIDDMQYWSLFKNLKTKLFKNLRDGYYELNVKSEEVKATIYADEQFSKQSDIIISAFELWENEVAPQLIELNTSVNPKVLIDEISNSLLTKFEDIKLIDKYDVYQILMEYWNSTMQDDVYAICFDGWKSGTEIDVEFAESKTKETDKPKPAKEIGWQGKLLPKDIMIESFFKAQKVQIDSIENDANICQSEIDAIIEEYCSEDSLLAEYYDKEKLLLDKLKKDIKDNKLDDEALEVAKKLVMLKESSSKYTKSLKELNTELDKLVRAKYPTLTTEQIKHLVLNQKWFGYLYAELQTVYQNICHKITNQIVELVERYETTLSEIETQVTYYESKVKDHLKRMGFEI